MSGSFNRPPRRPGSEAQAARIPEYSFEPYDEVVTAPAPASGNTLSGYRAEASDTFAPDALPETTQQPSLEAVPPDIYAPARAAQTGKEQTYAPIVPAASVTGSSLTLVISIMCFLACLTTGAVFMINETATAWLKDIASEITVQIEPQQNTDVDKLLAEVSAFLKKQPGVTAVRSIDVAETSELLQPWLGQTELLGALPIPRLIAIELDRNSPPDLEKVRTALNGAFKGASLDDHRRWQQQIRTVTRSFALGGLAILLLVAAATTAIIIAATKSSMASNREIVEVLHFVGATDRFIAREFEKHFLRLGVRAGLVGAISAMLVFAVMPTVMELLGGGAVTLTEINRLVGSGALDTAGYVLLGIVVVVVAALCMLTSRLGVYRILNARR